MIQWNDDQRALRELIEGMADVLSKDHIEDDQAGTFPRHKWDQIAQTGLLGLPFAPEWGGLGQDLLTTLYVLEGLGYACRDGGLSFSVSTHLASTGTPLNRFGSRELKERYLPGVCAGTLIGAHAITEPSGGSEALNMSTTAVADGDHFVLNGSKTFISNAPIADLIVVYARTGTRGSPGAITAFLVERDTPGLTVGKSEAKLGLRTSPLSELFFDNCRVPGRNVLGRVGSGFLVLDYVMKREILYSFIINVGEMQHRLERCLEYARTRTQFGKPIGSFQSIANRLVDMKIGTETARTWLYGTAQKVMANKDTTVDIAISKLVASEQNLASALSAVQIFGGYGYLAEYGLEKDLRNAVGGTIYSGTTEIQRARIAAMLGL